MKRRGLCRLRRDGLHRIAAGHRRIRSYPIEGGAAVLALVVVSRGGWDIARDRRTPSDHSLAGLPRVAEPWCCRQSQISGAAPMTQPHRSLAMAFPMSNALSLALLSNSEMAEADRLTIAGGTPGSSLMEQAGAAVANEAAGLPLPIAASRFFAAGQQGRRRMGLRRRPPARAPGLCDRPRSAWSREGLRATRRPRPAAGQAYPRHRGG